MPPNCHRISHAKCCAPSIKPKVTMQFIQEQLQTSKDQKARIGKQMLAKIIAFTR